MALRWNSPLGRSLTALSLLAGGNLAGTAVAQSPQSQVGSPSVCDRCGRARPAADAPKTSGPYRSRTICGGCGQDMPLVAPQALPAGQSYGSGPGASAQALGSGAYGYTSAGAAYQQGGPGAMGALGAAGAGAAASGMMPSAPGAAAGTAPTAAPGAAEAAAAAAAEGGGAATGLGEGFGGAAGALVMFGDAGPSFGTPVPPGPPPRPGQYNVSPYKAGTVVPWVRNYKMAESQSPIPQDRVFFNFNYYNNLNYAINGRFGAPIGNLEAYRYFLGFEKTFLDGNASFGLRDTINTLSARSPVPGLTGTSTAIGDLNLFFKFVLVQNWEKGEPTGAYPNLAQFYRASNTNGYLVSTGLSLNFPTGPSQFAGASFSQSLRNTNIQPFIGYFARRGDFYVHGFEGIAVPTDSRDVTMLYNDIGMGYFVYRSEDPDAFISAIAPTFETHINVPLNHSNPFNLSDPNSLATVVDLTYGFNVLVGRRTLLSMALCNPITGPRPYNMEAMAFINYYFGGRRSRGPAATSPPLFGG